MLLTTVLALAAAAFFAVASALQHLSAGSVDDAGKARSSGARGFTSKTLRRPMWALGLAADIAGFALHAAALRSGPLTLVQPLLVTSVVFALPLRQLLERRRPHGAELGWAAALALGLALFFVVATPAGGTAQAPDTVPTVVFGALIGVGTLASAVAGWYLSGGKAASLLGFAAALVFAACAGLLKEVMNISSRGAVPVVTAWPLYALVCSGAAGLLLSQLAYQAGPLRFSLPIFTTVGPLLSCFIGVAVFDEHFRSGAGDIAGEVLGLALVSIAAVALTRGRPGPPTHVITTGPASIPAAVRSASQPVRFSVQSLR